MTTARPSRCSSSARCTAWTRATGSFAAAAARAVGCPTTARPPADSAGAHPALFTRQRLRRPSVSGQPAADAGELERPRLHGVQRAAALGDRARPHPAGVRLADALPDLHHRVRLHHQSAQPQQSLRLAVHGRRTTSTGRSTSPGATRGSRPRCSTCSSTRTRARTPEFGGFASGLMLLRRQRRSRPTTPTGCRCSCPSPRRAAAAASRCGAACARRISRSGAADRPDPVPERDSRGAFSDDQDGADHQPAGLLRRPRDVPRAAARSGSTGPIRRDLGRQPAQASQRTRWAGMHERLCSSAAARGAVADAGVASSRAIAAAPAPRFAARRRRSFQDDGRSSPTPPARSRQLRLLGVERVRLFSALELTIAPAAELAHAPETFTSIDPAAYPKRELGDLGPGRHDAPSRRHRGRPRRRRRRAAVGDRRPARRRTAQPNWEPKPRRVRRVHARGRRSATAATTTRTSAPCLRETRTTCPAVTSGRSGTSPTTARASRRRASPATSGRAQPVVVPQSARRRLERAAPDRPRRTTRSCSARWRRAAFRPRSSHGSAGASSRG